MLERDRVLDELQRLRPEQLQELMTRAAVPARLIASPEAALAKRVTDLLLWAEQPNNWDTLVGALQRVTRDVAAEGTAAGADAVDQVWQWRGELLGVSRAPIVLALEAAESPLLADELQQTERHLTLPLQPDHLQALDRIVAALAAATDVAALIEAGRSAWQVLIKAQPRLEALVQAVRSVGHLQPVAWSGRTEMLVRLRPALLAVWCHGTAAGEVDDWLSVGGGAAYFAPVDSARRQWMVLPSKQQGLSVGALGIAMSGGTVVQAGAELAGSEVALMAADDAMVPLAALLDALRTRGGACTRVAVLLGAFEPTTASLHAALERLGCLSVAGPAVPSDAVAAALREAFLHAGATQAAPCITAAVRRSLLAHAWRRGDFATLRDALLWSTWCWIGRPLFADRFGDTPRAAYPHLMDLRTVAAEGWYFPRRAGVPDRYRADALLRGEEPFHLYLSGAGGTGKSCFLRYVYEQSARHDDRVAVWYRVDAPGSEWVHVERRLIEETSARVREKWPEHATNLLPAGGGRLADYLRELSRRLRADIGQRLEVIVFIDQLERTFESGDEPDQRRLDDISSEVISLLKTVKTGEGVRVFIASRKQYLPDFLKSFQAADESGLQFNVLQAISDTGERRGFVDQVQRWCREHNLVDKRFEIDRAAATLLFDRVDGHPLNLMLSLIQLLSDAPAGRVDEQEMERRAPWVRKFDLDLEVFDKDEIDRYFLLAMAHARSEIVRFEEVWWRLRMVDPRLTRRVDELRPRGVIERLWLLGYLGRTIHPRPHGDDPARFLEFFHANLRDHLLSEVMGGGGSGPRHGMPATWRALDRLAAYAHEWTQIEQLLPQDDIQALMTHREVVVDRLAAPGEAANEPLHLLFQRASTEARKTLRRNACECLVLSALVSDELGTWAFETLFPEADEQLECCRSWLQRTPAERRRPVLEHVVRMKAPDSRELLADWALDTAPGPASEIWRDLARVLAAPLFAARYRDEVLSAILERLCLVAAGGPPGPGDLPPRFGDFIVACCNGEREKLLSTLARCAQRLQASRHQACARMAAELPRQPHIDAWLAGDRSAVAPAREPDQAAPMPPLQLLVSPALFATVDARRADWRTELQRRLGIPLPEFSVGEGELEPREMQLRVHGESVAQGEFDPTRRQILKRHWDRERPTTAPEARVTQDDALQEVVLWVEPGYLAKEGWLLPALDFDQAVLAWLEAMLRDTVDTVFDFDQLLQFLHDAVGALDRGRLFREYRCRCCAKLWRTWCTRAYRLPRGAPSWWRCCSSRSTRSGTTKS